MPKETGKKDGFEEIEVLAPFGLRGTGSTEVFIWKET